MEQTLILFLKLIELLTSKIEHKQGAYGQYQAYDIINI